MTDELAFWENSEYLSLKIVFDKVHNILENELIHRKEHPELSKKFFEEIAPITFLAQHLNATKIQFTNDKREHKSFDAMIQYSDGTEQQIECTCAIDGAEDALIDEYLDKYHIVSLNMPIEFEGTKKTRILHEQPEQFVFKNVIETWNRINKLIQKSISKKTSTPKTDYKDAILLVVVDTSGTSVSRLNKYLTKYYSENSINKDPFKEIFLISRNPQNYFDLFIKL